MSAVLGRNKHFKCVRRAHEWTAKATGREWFIVAGDGMSWYSDDEPALEWRRDEWMGALGFLAGCLDAYGVRNEVEENPVFAVFRQNIPEIRRESGVVDHGYVMGVLIGERVVKRESETTCYIDHSA